MIKLKPLYNEIKLFNPKQITPDIVIDLLDPENEDRWDKQMEIFYKYGFIKRKSTTIERFLNNLSKEKLQQIYIELSK